VTLLAGSGTRGRTNGTGSAATFNAPTGVAVDSNGNVYVADESSHVIRMITSAGVVTTLAGSGTLGHLDGTGTAATFGNPAGVALDPTQHILYVTDAGYNNIRAINLANLAVTTLAGNYANSGLADGTGTAASFYLPSGVTVDPAGNLFVVDVSNNEVRLVSPTGVVTTLAGAAGQGFVNGEGTSAEFYLPGGGVGFDSANNLYVVDTYNNQIRKITRLQ
jgi:DNA-binding beta-propeller fold protein YncE